METNPFFEKLIASVEAHPVVYDKSHKHYYNIIEKQKVWKTIAAECKKSESECKHRWKLLRERYGKQLKKMDSKKGIGQPWCYLDSLGFLKESLCPRRYKIPISRIRDNATKDNSQSTDVKNLDCAENSMNFSDINLSNLIDESEEYNMQEVSEKAKSLPVAAPQLIAPVATPQLIAPVPPAKPSLVAAQCKTIELLMEDLSQDVQDKFFTKVFGELMVLRSEARKKKKKT